MDEGVVGGHCEGTAKGEGINAHSHQLLNNTQAGEDPNLCKEHWENMKNQFTARMWGIFEETGIFLALCRHGFVLIATNMIRSGEL